MTFDNNSFWKDLDGNIFHELILGLNIKKIICWKIYNEKIFYFYCSAPTFSSEFNNTTFNDWNTTSNFPLGKRIFGEGHYLRLCMIEINRCERVLLKNYTVINSPFWVNHLNCLNHIQVIRLKINSLFPNNDGVDIDSCQYVLVEENIFKTGDDSSITVKSGCDSDGRKIALPSKYVIIHKNNIVRVDDALVLGYELSGGISYIFFEDNILRNGLCA